ncbi:MAG TPA: cytochrome C [Desulfobacteraceae bacterium]|nr:cytochrome C [Desulfobacteraceae bacterium]
MKNEEKVMYKKAVIVGIFILSLTFTGAAFGAGSANIVLKGGHFGDIHFPHKLHQDTLKNCKLCHKMFPMKKGAIEDLIAKKTLKKKEVMKNCEKCHRADKAKGVKTGPTSCRGCHKK